MSICSITVTYNRKESLRIVLESLKNQKMKLDEIIVIDNASIDGTDRMVEEEFPEVTYIRLSENTGSAGGYYKGL